MPNIKPYQLQTEAGKVPDVARGSGASFGAAGAGMQNLADAGFQLADIVRKNQEQSEVSNIHASISKTQADWTARYQDELQKGTLDTEQFTKDFSDAMDEQQDNVSTRAGRLYFQQASAELKGHFLEKAALGQAQIAGKKAVSNYESSLSNSSSTLLNDPSSFELTNKMQQQGIQNLVTTGGLPATAAGELQLKTQTELAKSAVRGWIKLNPDDAKAQLNEGKWDKYIDGDLKHQLFGEADQATRAQSVEQERLQKQYKEVIVQQQTKTQNDFLQQMVDGKLSAKEILQSNLDAFGSGSKEQFLKMLEQQNKEKLEKLRTDPGVYVDLWDKVHLPDGDPKKIVDENQLNQYMGRGLTVQDINVLRGEIQGKKTIAGSDEAELKKGLTDIAKGKLTKSNPLLGKVDPEGDIQYQKFLVGFLNEYGTQRKAGKTPQQLLSPESPDYLGKNIDQYQRSSQQIIRDLVKSGNKNTNANVAPVGDPMIGVIAPDGRPGKLPQSKIEEAKKQGFKVTE